MTNSNQNKTTKVLGYLYLFLAILGVFYFILSFTSALQKPTAEQLIMRQYCRTMLLMCLIIETLLGVYIVSATHKIFLFMQSLATMLIMASHGFFVYAYFTVQSSIEFTAQNAMNTALVLLIVSGLMHLSTIFQHKFGEPEVPEHPLSDAFDDFEN